MDWRSRLSIGTLTASNALVLPIYTVATLPTGVKAGTVVLVSNADTTTSVASLVVYDGSGWFDMVDGTAAAADA